LIASFVEPRRLVSELLRDSQERVYPDNEKPPH
jgi:hypothetical protein